MIPKFQVETLRKLMASGRLKIDKPGIIIHRNPGFLGSNFFDKRVIYMFEEIYESLYIDTLNKIGKAETEELWYKIGKDISVRYLHNFKGIDRDKKNIPLLIKYFSGIFDSIGISAFDEVSVDIENVRFIFSGRAPRIYSGEKSFSFLEGTVSGMLSFVLGENIEARSYVGAKDSIVIIANKFFDERHFHCKEVLSEILKHAPNFEKEKSIFSGLSSFADFLKFKIIEFGDDGFMMSGKKIIPQEIGAPSIFANNYSKIGQIDLLEDSILKSSEKICSELFCCHESIDKRIKLIRNACSATGFGEIYFSRGEDGIIVGLLNPFFVRGNPSFVHLFFNGALNAIHEKKFILKSKTEMRFEYCRSSQ